MTDARSRAVDIEVRFDKERGRSIATTGAKVDLGAVVRGRPVGSQLRKAQRDGWWRLGSDLDGLSEQAQELLADSISEVRRQTAQDGKLHTVVFGGQDDNGSWLIIVATGPSTAESTTHLQAYLRAKKHTVAADRAAGILLDLDGSIVTSAWEDLPPGPDPDRPPRPRAAVSATGSDASCLAASRPQSTTGQKAQEAEIGTCLLRP